MHLKITMNSIISGTRKTISSLKKSTKIQTELVRRGQKSGMASKNKTKIILKHYFSLNENTFSIFQILVFRYPKAPIKMRIYFIPRYLTIMGRGLQKNLIFFSLYVKHCVLACRTDWSISYKPVRFLIYFLFYFGVPIGIARYLKIWALLSFGLKLLGFFSCFYSSFISWNPVY